MLAVGNECLGAVDNIAVTIGPGRRLDVLQIRTCAWLGHGDGGNFLAACHRRQIPTFLILAAIVQNIMGDNARMDPDHTAGNGRIAII